MTPICLGKVFLINARDTLSDVSVAFLGHLWAGSVPEIASVYSAL